jgi:predicted Zn-dependent protease
MFAPGQTPAIPRQTNQGQFVSIVPNIGPPARPQDASESSHPDLLNDLGSVRAASGGVHEAERKFRRVLAAVPNNAQAAINLGALLFDAGRIDAAEYWLERALQSIDETRRATVHNLLAQGYAPASPSSAPADLAPAPAAKANPARAASVSRIR